MRTALVLVLVLVLAACSAHSNAGAFVTDLKLTQAGLEVDRCDMVEEMTNMWWVGLLFLGALGGGGKSYETRAENCHAHHVQTWSTGSPEGGS